MKGRNEGTAHRQANRPNSTAALRRNHRESIAAARNEYERATRIAAIVLGIAFGIMFALGILAG